MADRIIKVLTAATSFDLVTLQEAKMMLGISLTDTSEDAQLQFWIDINSQTIMRMCNRIFAREEVREEWRELNGGLRIFPSHWPIASADLASVESPAGSVLDPSTYELEEQSGKIEFFGGAACVEPIVVTYTGGYVLPDEAPGPLKRAISILNLQMRFLASMGPVAGIRLLSHKEARVSFHDPAKILALAMGQPGHGPFSDPVMQLLSHYMHLEV